MINSDMLFVYVMDLTLATLGAVVQAVIGDHAVT